MFQLLSITMNTNFQPLQASPASVRQPTEGCRGCRAGQGRTRRAAETSSHVRHAGPQQPDIAGEGEAGCAGQDLENGKDGDGHPGGCDARAEVSHEVSVQGRLEGVDRHGVEEEFVGEGEPVRRRRISLVSANSGSCDAADERAEEAV